MIARPPCFSTRRTFNNDLQLIVDPRPLGQGKITLGALVGANLYLQDASFVEVSGSSIVIPDYFNIGNFVTQTTNANLPTKRRLVGAYSQVTADYGDWAFLTLTGRNDWSSTLPTNANSYFYPSASLAIVFTDALKWRPSWLDFGKLQRTVRTAMRMLDNVIDINYYAVGKARNSNLRHRPVGLGLMGFQDCLHRLRVPYASPAAVEFADRSMEMVAYAAYWASTELAAERGRYASFHGSLWERGILPQDTLDILSAERGGYVELDRSSTLNWDALRARIKRYGMRNSNCLAIAPTATIANIVGVSASIEPTYQNLFVKSNLSGEFTVVNDYLVADLKRAGLWDEVMIADLKYFDGNLARIDRAPGQLRKLYATAFEIEPKWLVECAARRQKWIDQSQSLNIYMAGASGKKLDETYKLAWIRGLKTTYYLRALGATHAEKSTVKTGELNAVPSEEPKLCAIDKPDCEACQ